MPFKILQTSTGAAVRAVAGALLAASAVAAAAAPVTQEYLLTVTRPGQLHVIDMASHAILRSCDIPGKFGSGSIAPSPDGRVAYVLSNLWEDVYGIDITDCKVVFSARQSKDNIRVKTFQSVTVSADGKELYTVQNPVRLLPDRFEVMEPRLAVYSTSGGLDAPLLKSFPVSRRITKIAATQTGEVILGGADVTAIDPKTGATRVVTALANWDRGPQWLTPDAFAMHSQGEQAAEYIMPYVTARFTDETQNMETAEWWWGMSRVDLKTGKAEQREIVPFEFIVFNFITDPTNPDILFGSFNQLSKHDLRNQKTLAVEPMPHTYYNLNITSDGRKIFVGGAANDISIHDAETLKKIGSIELPGDMSTSDLRVARRLKD
jgi:quinohemoprotein amine dehydrogenase beta subunit